MIKETGHSYSVDWWAIGILIYEMVVGFPPFYHKNQNTMYDLIERFPVKFPDPEKHGIDMSKEAKDIISRFLEKDPEKRLGKLICSEQLLFGFLSRLLIQLLIGSKDGIEEVISHPWFDEYDVDKLLNKKYEPPYIPELSKDVEDVSNFDKRFTSEMVKHSIITKKDLLKIQKYAHEFEDF